MGAALGGNQGMDLVDDDGVDGAERVGGLGSEQQVERLGSGDEDFGGLAAEAGALALGGVAGADADERLVERDAAAAGHVGDAGEGRAQVALHVDGEGLEGRNIDDAAALFLALPDGVEHQPVEAPEEGREGFAGSGGSQDEGAFAAGDDRPAQSLRGGGCVKDGLNHSAVTGWKQANGSTAQNRSRRVAEDPVRIGLGRAGTCCLRE